MKFVLNALNKLKGFVVSLFTPEGQKKVDAAFTQASHLLDTALPIVEMIAKLTPTKADDEIIAVVKKFSVPVEITGPLSDVEKGLLLKQAAVSGLRLAANAAGVPDSVIDLAVQLAYTAYRASTR